MSAIPPNVAASVLQSGVAQQTQSQAQDAAETAKANASRELKGRDGAEDILEVEATDADSRVNADGGGGGSQGRHDAPPEEAATDESVVEHDEDGRPRLDISA